MGQMCLAGMSVCSLKRRDWLFFPTVIPLSWMYLMIHVCTIENIFYSNYGNLQKVLGVLNVYFYEDVTDSIMKQFKHLCNSHFSNLTLNTTIKYK